MSYTVQDYILTAKLAQKKLKQYHEMNRMNCISCRDIESDDGGYVFAEYNINDSKKDIKELKEYINTINHIIESSNYCGYVEMPEYPKSFGLLILYGNDCPLDETKLLYYKNPDGALKNKITRKKNSNIRSGKRANAHISPSPKKGKPKKEEVEDLEEAIIINKEDIYYNKEKLDSGEINLCFITGHSGSGKSTMGRNMMENNKKIEHYELDDVVMNENFSMDNLKEYGSLIYSFFNGVGKKYKITKEDIPSLNKKFKCYDKEVIQDFIKYSISYAKSHKNNIYVLEGIWLFMFIEPSELKDYAVYIKGTSVIISMLRAAKRDWNNDVRGQRGKNGNKIIWLVKRIITDLSGMTDFERKVKKYRQYFNNIIEESIYNIAEDAKRILYKEILSYQNIYQEVMLPYAISESYAIIDWNLQNIQEQDRIRFLKNKSSIYEYCSKIFNDIHPLYKMGMDEHCIYIQKI